jgi:hypothetical protein
MDCGKLISYFFLPLCKPGDTLDQFLAEKQYLLYSIGIFLFLGIMYTLSVQVAYMQGAGAVVEPFLKIPAADYYRYQRFYQIPFFFITSILFAGTARLLAVGFGGRGTFEKIFAVFCIAQTLPMFITMWIPETFCFIFFPGQSVIPLTIDIIRQGAGILWPLAITVAGIRKIEGVGFGIASAIVCSAALPVVAQMVIFIR